MNKTEFDLVWETEIKPPDDISGMDVVLVMDTSLSVISSDPKKIRSAAAKAFVDKLGENDRAAVGYFDSIGIFYQDFTNDHDLLYSAMDFAPVFFETNSDLSSGMQLAISWFTQNYTRTNAYKAVILLTDGNGSYDTSYTDLAAQNGITVYTVGFGNKVNKKLLTEIANGTGGKYYFASTADSCSDLYDDIASNTGSNTQDSNNDGISDYYTKLICEGKIVGGTGVNWFRGVAYNNFQANDDFDGDGLKNGEEMTVTACENGKVYLSFASNPCKKDSEGDGIEDAKDTAPLEKGLEGGVTGKMTLVSCYNSEDAGWTSGHAFLVYESYINDIINFSSLEPGWSRIDNSLGWMWENIKRDSFPNESYKINIGEAVTIGNGAMDPGIFQTGDGSGSSDSGSSDSGSSDSGSSDSGSSDSGSSGGSSDFSVGESNGVSYNMEVFKHLSPDPNLGYSYLSNTFLSQDITENDFVNVISYLGKESVNYWSLFHNCTTVACEAWNMFSDIKVDPYSSDFIFKSVATPKGLKINLRTIEGHGEDLVLDDLFQ